MLETGPHSVGLSWVLADGSRLAGYCRGLVRARSREAPLSKGGLEQLWGQDGGEAVPGDANGELQPSVILQ